MVRRAQPQQEPPQQALTPAPLAGREFRAMIGNQPIRAPIEIILGLFQRQLASIEEWKKTADGPSLLLYTGIRQSLNMAIPMIREFIKRNPDMPQMPERPRHSDPVLYLLGYFNAYTVDMITRGEFIVPVDETGLVTGFDWTALHAGEDPEQLEEPEDLEGDQEPSQEASI